MEIMQQASPLSQALLPHGEQDICVLDRPHCKKGSRKASGRCSISLESFCRRIFSLRLSRRLVLLPFFRWWVCMFLRPGRSQGCVLMSSPTATRKLPLRCGLGVSQNLDEGPEQTWLWMLAIVLGTILGRKRCCSPMPSSVGV